MRRTLYAAATAALVFVLAFLLLHALPGDPGERLEDPSVPAEQAGRNRRALGLDRPITEQFVHTVSGYARGDLGVSFSRHRPVRDVLADALPFSVALGGAALLIGYGIGAPAALVFLSLRPRPRRAADGLALVLAIVPRFWLGVMLVLVFHTAAGWLPASHAFSPGGGGGFVDRLSHLLLPALTLGLPAAAVVARITLASLERVLEAPHVRRARAGGEVGLSLLRRHVLPVGAAPLVAMLGLDLSAIVSGSLVVETVFAWPGVGRITAEAILASDYPLALASILLVSFTVAGGRVLAEAAAQWLDPRPETRA